MTNKASQATSVLCVLYVLTVLFLSHNFCAHYGILVEFDGGPLFMTRIYSLPIIVLAFLTGYHHIRLERPEKLLIISTFVIILFQRILMGKSACVGVLINTVFEPLMFYSVLRILSRKYVRTIQRIIIVFLLVECGLAIFEFITKIYIFSVYIYASIDYLTMRAASLHGHPLSNSFMVSIVIAVLVCSKLGSYKYFLYLFGYLAILCFNTRGAIIVMAGTFLLNFLRLSAFGRKGIGKKILLFAALGVIIYYGYDIVQEYGMGSRMEIELTREDGSANARYVLIDMLMKDMSGFDYLFGTQYKFVETMYAKYGIGFIENSILNFLLTYGIFYTVVFYFTWLLILNKINTSRFMRYSLFLVMFALFNVNNAIMSDVPIIPLAVMSLYCFRDEVFNNKIKSLNRNSNERTIG